MHRDHAHSNNTLFAPGTESERMWEEMDISKKQWEIRMFTEWSSVGMIIGMNNEGLVDVAKGKVFCKYEDIRELGLAKVANYVTNIQQNRHARHANKIMCISIVTKAHRRGDDRDEFRISFAVRGPQSRREIADRMLQCMHRKGIVPKYHDVIRSVRTARKYVGLLPDNKKLEMQFDHQRRKSRRFGEYGLALQQDKYQRLAAGPSDDEMSTISSDLDQVDRVKRKASRLSKQVVRAAIARIEWELRM